MKRITFYLLFFSFFLPSATFAQEEGYGFKAGLIYSNIKFVHNGKTTKGKPIFGPALGAVAYGHLGGNFGLYTEVVLFSTIGTDYTDTATFYDDNYGFALIEKEEKLRMWTGSWAVLPVFTFTENFFVMAGPQLDAIIASRYKGEMPGYGDDMTDLPATNFILNSNERIIKAGLVFGAGYSNKIFRADIRYNLGLSNLYDTRLWEDYPQYAGFTKAKYSSIQVSVAVIIPGMILGGSKTHWRTK